ncbi:hypothetical protein H4582DRAFT_2031268, partial [Lactarius indigo]
TRILAGLKPLPTALSFPPLGILYESLSSETGGRKMPHVGLTTRAPLHTKSSPYALAGRGCALSKTHHNRGGCGGL